MKRIVMHWTGGTNTPGNIDKKHYHFIIAWDGSVHDGDLKPEANLNVGDGLYAAHTRRLNTGSIGVALAGMHDAKEIPFDAGQYPINGVQVEAFVDLVADLCETYGIAVTRKTVLTHAEVQTTLGVKQRAKWDITWLPDMTRPADAIAVGDRLREMVSEKMAPKPDILTPKPHRTWFQRYFWPNQ